MEELSEIKKQLGELDQLKNGQEQQLGEFDQLKNGQEQQLGELDDLKNGQEQQLGELDQLKNGQEQQLGELDQLKNGQEQQLGELKDGLEQLGKRMESIEEKLKKKVLWHLGMNINPADGHIFGYAVGKEQF